MIRRLYVHNFRCLENFELPIAGMSSTLLIGKNGSGKTTIRLALEILQKIARGTNRVKDLVKPQDLARGRADVPMRFEIEVDLAGEVYTYTIAFEFPEGFKELRVFEEKLTAGGRPVYSRDKAQVQLARAGKEREAKFLIDWHLVALPIIQQQSEVDPLFAIRQWMARMLILSPIPSLILGDSTEGTLEPNVQVTNLGAWFHGVFSNMPSAYGRMSESVRGVMPDLKDIKNRQITKDFRVLEVQFSADQNSIILPFEELSDGEKCFFIGGMVMAANEAHGPLFCFWDEPDNYLAMSEVGHFVMALRSHFQDSGQFVATSHNPEAIRRFSDENTLVLDRKSHLEPTIVRRLSEIHVDGDLVGALIRGDVEL